MLGRMRAVLAGLDTHTKRSSSAEQDLLLLRRLCAFSL